MSDPKEPEEHAHEALHREGERQLRAMLEEGLKSGERVPVDEAYWSELRAAARGRR